MQEIQATISALGHDGRGVARIEGKTTFVSGALVDEQVSLRIRKRHRHFDEAEVVQVLTPSPHRVEPKCRHFGACGGCSLQHMDAEAQIHAKQQVLADNFALLVLRAGRTDGAPTPAILEGMKRILWTTPAAASSGAKPRLAD